MKLKPEKYIGEVYVISNQYQCDVFKCTTSIGQITGSK